MRGIFSLFIFIIYFTDHGAAYANKLLQMRRKNLRFLSLEFRFYSVPLIIVYGRKHEG